MDHTLLVGCLEGLGDLCGVGKGPVDAQRATLENCRQIFARDQLHGDEALAVRALVQAVHRSDVGVVQRGEELGLAFESRQPFGVGAQSIRQHLDRHLALERGVGGRPHDAHPALAELVDEPVVEKSRT